MRNVHSCIEAHIEDVSNTTVDIVQQPCCCIPLVVDACQDADISIVDNENGTCRIIDMPSGAYVCMEAVGGADITMDWVCGTDYSVNYLKVTPTEVVWISIDYDVDYNVYSNTDWLVS